MTLRPMIQECMFCFYDADICLRCGLHRRVRMGVCAVAHVALSLVAAMVVVITVIVMIVVVVAVVVY